MNGYINILAVDPRRKAIYVAVDTTSAIIQNAPISTVNPYPTSAYSMLIFKTDLQGVVSAFYIAGNVLTTTDDNTTLSCFLYHRVSGRGCLVVPVLPAPSICHRAST